MTTTATVAEFVAVVRSFVGTRYQHRGRLPGIGLDCVGIPIVGLARVGLVVQEPPPYGMIPSGLIDGVNGLATYCDKVEVPQVGDIEAIMWGREPRHCAIVIDVRRDGCVWIVHARARNGQVSCEPLTRDYCVHSHWRVRGLG